jgi:predicted O-methyltransferase YrrM
MGLSWLVEGLHPEGCLISVEKDEKLLNIARSFFEDDSRIKLINEDASSWIENNLEQRFDLIFADTWAGKFSDLESVLQMVKPNGFYLIDDLNYQAHWPGYHQEKVLFLVEKLKYHTDFYAFPIDVGSGLLLLCRK